LSLPPYLLFAASLKDENITVTDDIFTILVQGIIDYVKPMLHITYHALKEQIEGTKL